MERFEFDYRSLNRCPTGQSHAGLAGSGDMEPLIQPSEADAARVLIVTSDDGFARGSEALAIALRAVGDGQIATLHLSTIHSYSNKRIALSKAVLDGSQQAMFPTASLFRIFRRMMSS